VGGAHHRAVGARGQPDHDLLGSQGDLAPGGDKVARAFLRGNGCYCFVHRLPPHPGQPKSGLGATLSVVRTSLRSRAGQASSEGFLLSGGFYRAISSLQTIGMITRPRMVESAGIAWIFLEVVGPEPPAHRGTVQTIACGLTIMPQADISGAIVIAFTTWSGSPGVGVGIGVVIRFQWT
jgi:hypothetical protein